MGLQQRFSTSARGTNQFRGGSAVGVREGFMKNSILEKIKICVYIQTEWSRKCNYWICVY